MHIHFGKVGDYLQSVEITRALHHKALPHLCKLIKSNKNGHLHTLNKICVEKSALNDDDYYALEDIFFQCHNLHEIKLYANHMDTEHVSNLFSAFQGNNLTTISLTDNWIGERVSMDFFKFLNNQTTLQYLDFSLNWLGDQGMAALLESINKNILQLLVSCNDFHLVGMKAICHFISQCNQISDLDISYNRLDAKATEYIASIISKSDTISSIKANSNQIGDSGAMLIADAIKQNDTLTSLDVSDNKISWRAAKYLIESALATGKIKYLDLRHNGFHKKDILPNQFWLNSLDVRI